MNGEEFGYAVDAGMTPLRAIEAGTANGPDTLGPQAPLSGQLKEGYDADFIALSQNPVENIEILAEPAKITHVWKGAKCFKSPGRPVMII
jgi:imidazolonepropionase-like amidohydrolase